MTILTEARRQNRDRRADRVSCGFVRMAMAVCLAFVCGVVASLPAQAATKIDMTMSQADGYGRIVFHWPGHPPHHTEFLSANVLVVKFDKPFEVDLDEFMRRLPQFVALARQDKDGETLRLGLKSNYHLNVQEAENSVYIDLLPSDWSGVVPPLPADVLARLKEAAAKKAAKAAADKLARERGIVDPKAPLPDLSVRVAAHDGITRLMFDWNQPVLYSLSQHDGAATITFDRTAKVALAQIRVNPPPFLKTISALERNGRLSIFMKLDSGIIVSDFREDLGVVLDLKPHQMSSGQFVDDSVDKATADAGETAKVKTDTKAEATVDPHAPKSIVPQDAVALNEAKTDAPAETEDKSAANVVAVPDTKAAEVKADAPVEEISSVSETLKVTGFVTANRSEIVFPWRLPAGAAVFVRSDKLWVVFDRHATFDFTALDLASLKAFGSPVLYELKDASVISFSLSDPNLLVGVEEKGTAWHVSLARSLASTGRSISLARSWSASGEGYVSADLVRARKIVTFQDPDVRDTLLIATARGDIQALQGARSFIEFQALKSAQGLVIARVADDLNVAAAPDAVIISRTHGLTLSAAKGDKGTVSGNGVAGNSPAMMDFALWRGKGNFISNRQRLMNRAVMAAPADQAAARLDYARFFLANRMAMEALTQMRLAEKSDIKLENDTSFRALRGVAEVMAHQNRQAVADLSAGGLDLDPYAAGWRGLAHAELGQMNLANKDFDFAGGLIDMSDPETAVKMHLAAAGAALAMKEISSAHSHLGHLPATLDDTGEQAHAYVLRARLLAAMKKPGEAVNFYDRAIALNDRKQMVVARFEKALLLNKTDKLSNDDLLAELNRLRMMWRGDDLECRILRKVAEKELERGKVVEALEAMRIATQYFPSNDAAQAMGAKMPEIFADYFIGPGSKELSGVQALAFYYEFQDLTPIGPKGDELIRKLAERLVSIDLLPQAEVLLRYQVEQRLYGGVAKAQVGARLANIYLLDDKPKQALQIIRSTMQNQLPPDLKARRQLIEARALASRKQFDLSLDLLSELDGQAADELRAEVYWESENWDIAGQTAEALADKASANQAPEIALSDDARFYVMRSAIAYSMGSNDKGLARLRTKFGTRMASSVDASGFAVVSDPIETSGVAFRQLASRIAAVNMIERFVASLKEDTPRAPAKAAKAAGIDSVAVN